MKGLKAYMDETKQVDRWFILRVGLVGMFAGAALATVFYWGLIVL